MGLYRARDLLLVPSLLSLARVPLAALFALVVDRPLAGLAVLAAAGVTDVLDGWYARRFDQATPLGAVVDPITDKVFVLSVIVALIAAGQLPLYALPLLHARELGELPLMVWLATDRDDRARKHEANTPGKVATALQFVCLAASLYGLDALDPLLALTAVVGAVAAAAYWRRALLARRSSRAGTHEPAED